MSGTEWNVRPLFYWDLTLVHDLLNTSSHRGGGEGEAGPHSFSDFQVHSLRMQEMFICKFQDR